MICCFVWDRQREWHGICGGWQRRITEDKVVTSPAAKGGLSRIADQETLFIRFDRGNFRVLEHVVGQQLCWYGEHGNSGLGADRQAALEAALVNIPGNQESAPKSIM